MDFGALFIAAILLLIVCYERKQIKKREANYSERLKNIEMYYVVSTEDRIAGLQIEVEQLKNELNKANLSIGVLKGDKE